MNHEYGFGYFDNDKLKVDALRNQIIINYNGVQCRHFWYFNMTNYDAKCILCEEERTLTTEQINIIEKDDGRFISKETIKKIFDDK